MIIILISVVLFIIGASLGSFMSVILFRLNHATKSIVKGRSACIVCDKPLKAHDLIPILSFILLRGKCRYCKNEISSMYPLLELIMGMVLVILYFQFPFIDASLFFSGTFIGLFLLYSFYSFVLIFTFFFDLKYLQISDELLLPAILIGLIATIAAPLTPSLIDALIGASIGVAFFGLQYLISKGRWIGLGDLRIGAFMGIILGWKLLIVALFCSYLLGSIISLIIIARKKAAFDSKIPFAPFLVCGTFITLFFGTDLLHWYLGLLGL